MICKTCAVAADETRRRIDDADDRKRKGWGGSGGGNRNVHHRCEYPVSCTCQHRKQGSRG